MTFLPAFRLIHIDFIVINLGIENFSEDIQQIDFPALFSDQRDEVQNSGEFSDRCIGFSKVHSFIKFNYYVCFVSYGAVRIVFCLVDLFGASWLESQLPCFPGVDRWERVIE